MSSVLVERAVMSTGPEFERVDPAPDFYELYFGRPFSEEEIENMQTIIEVEDLSRVIDTARQCGAEIDDTYKSWVVFVRPRPDKHLITFMLKEV